MITLLNKKSIHYILYFLLLGYLAFALFQPALQFTFWKDDWSLIWGSLHNVKSLSVYVLHPGTFFEFFLFSHLFYAQPLAWQIFGIVLRITAAFLFAAVIRLLTKSSKTAFVAGIFLAVSYYGMESVVWATAHIATLTLCFFLLSLYCFIRWEDKKGSKHLWIVFLSIAFLFDPGRMFPGLIVFAYLHTVVYKHSLNKIIKPFIIGVLLFVPFIFWFFFIWRDSLLSKILVLLVQHPQLLFHRLYVVYNFLAAVGNIFIGLIYPMMQDEQNTGVYRRIFALAGLIMLLFSCVLLFLKVKRKAKIHPLLILFLFWPFIFYFPNWIFEPRAPMAGPHRYDMVASLGLIGLMAIAAQKIKHSILLWLFVLLIIYLNTTQVDTILTLESPFRSKDIVNKLWNTINKDVSPADQQYSFILSGDQPLLSQGLLLSGGVPFALERGISRRSTMPFIGSYEDMQNILCGVPSIKKSQFIDTVYSWELKNPDILTNTTNATRNLLQKSLDDQLCSKK